MQNIVDYVLNLKDNLSPALQHADMQAKKLEGTVGLVKGALGALGMSFAAFQGFQFVKGGIEKFHDLEQVTAKVEANLSATNQKAGLSIETISQMAKEMSSKVQYSRSEILDMQSQLLTFPSITKDVFGRSMGLIADIAKQTGHDLTSTAIMYGKALNSPIDGLQKMQRYGVIFSDAEKKRISDLQKQGDLIAAQKAMMDAIANSGYGGVAERMFNADPVARFNKAIGSIQMQLGEIGAKILKEVVPIFEKVADGIKDVIKWAKENKETIKDLATALIIYKGIEYTIIAALKLRTFWLGLASTAQELYTAFVIASSEGLGVLTSAQWALNVAMDANPIGLIITAISALIFTVYKAIDAYEKWGATLLMFMGLLGQIINMIMAIKNNWNSVVEAFKSEGMIGAIKRIAIVISDAILYPLQQSLKIIHDITGIKKIGNWSNDVANIRERLDLVNPSATPMTIFMPPKPGAKGAGNALQNGNDDYKAEKLSSKASAAKNITLTVTYNAPIIKDFTISTTNITDGLDALKEKVADILMQATHDSLLIANY